MKWVCIKEWRMITIGTIVDIQPIGVGHFADSYTITPENTNRSRIANYTTIKEYFKKVEETK